MNPIPQHFNGGCEDWVPETGVEDKLSIRAAEILRHVHWKPGKYRGGHYIVKQTDKGDLCFSTGRFRRWLHRRGLSGSKTRFTSQSLTGLSQIDAAILHCRLRDR